MESGRVPLPAARYTVPHVGAPRDQGPGGHARVHPQIHRLLRRGEPADGQVHPCPLAEIQRGDLCGLPQNLAAAPFARQAHGDVLDNATYHHARLLAPWLHKHRRVLTLLFLPPYSPQLSPIERVWKLTRRLATHNRYFATLDELLDAAETCFNRWRKPNPVLRRLCGIS